MEDDDLKKMFKGAYDSPIVQRSHIKKLTGGLLDGKTVANYDSLGTGPPKRFRMGNKIFYPVDEFLDWFIKRSKIERIV